MECSVVFGNTTSWPHSVSEDLRSWDWGGFDAENLGGAGCSWRRVATEIGSGFAGLDIQSQSVSSSLGRTHHQLCSVASWGSSRKSFVGSWCDWGILPGCQGQRAPWVETDNSWVTTLKQYIGFPRLFLIYHLTRLFAQPVVLNPLGQLPRRSGAGKRAGVQHQSFKNNRCCWMVVLCLWLQPWHWKGSG